MASHNRQHFRERRVVAINVMGSPGAGKTAVLEATARQLGSSRRLGALAGDLATERDAERLSAAGITAKSITTGSACHLDAQMVHRGLHQFPWRELDYLFIENVGNLVCPAIYDLGQAANVIALAVTEGEDKPLKYPVMFRKADLVLITKIDLLPHLPGVHVDTIADALRRVMPRPVYIPVSATTGEGIDRWLEWLDRVGVPQSVQAAHSA
jgi:hydrogenase nickel incorporation protein HypB